MKLETRWGACAMVTGLSPPTTMAEMTDRAKERLASQWLDVHHLGSASLTMEETIAAFYDTSVESDVSCIVK